MYNLTLQVYTAGNWHDAMVLGFDNPEKGFEGRCSFGYEQSYLVDNYADIPTPFAKAVSARFPLEWEGKRSNAPARLMALPDILADSGLPDVTMNHPRIDLKNLARRMKEWDLI